MAECPAGHELEDALRSRCLGCGCQCVIGYLRNRIQQLENEIAEIKRDID